MRRGFGYVYFLMIVAVVLTVMAATTGTLTRYKKIVAMDRAQLTARYMADSAVAYESVATPSGQNVPHPSVEVLLLLPGIEAAFSHGGFRIVDSQGIRYYVGYAGRLPQPTAVTILMRKGNKLQPYEI